MTMDVNELRTLLLVVNFAVFVGIVWWAYSGKRKQRFDEAAMLPLDDEPAATSSRAGHPR
jgi:cytochrome c oxidase cbb3-type subunit 4